MVQHTTSEPQQTSLLSSEDDGSFAPPTENALEEPQIAEDESHPKGFLRLFFATRGAPQLLFLALLMSLAFGPIVSTVPSVMEDRYARLLHGYDGISCASFDRGDKPDACLSGGDNGQNAAAKSSFANNIFLLVASSLIGSISDCRGRKGFLALSFFLSILAPLALLMVELSDKLNPVWYYVADSSSGLCDFYVISFSMLSDLMPPEFRAPANGLFFSAFLLGFALSQLLALYLSHLVVTFVSVALLIVGFLFVLVAIDETLPEDTAKIALEKRHSTDGICWGTILRPVKEMTILNRDAFLRTLAAITFCSGMVYSSDKTLIVYYMENQLAIPYQEISVMFILMAILGAVNQVFVLKAAIGCLGEKNVLVIACLCGTTHNFLYGIASSRLTVTAALCISELTNMGFPVLVSMRSNHANEDEQGRIQGAFSSLAAIADAIGPISLQFIYHHTENTTFPGPGTMFFFAALVYFVGAGFATYLQVSETRSKTEGDQILDCDHAREPLLLNAYSEV